MGSDTVQSSPAMGSADAITAFARWCRREPLAALLLGLALGVLVYMFGFLKLFTNGKLTAAQWAIEAWTPEGNQEHSWLVPPIALFLVWYHREKLRAAKKAGENIGFAILACGVLVFVLSARALQPRLALLSVPFLALGLVWSIWGRQVARIILFPSAFLVFTIPFAALEQASFRLQFVVTGAVGVLSKLFGISVQAVGTTLTAADGSFDFEIAEGCSGIRSLIAMAMLTALYVHLTQRDLWKKVVIFSAAIPFAIIGNIGRIFTVILVAKFIDKDIAGGLYHDYSGFIFFPFAVAAMVGFGKLLNARFESVPQVLAKAKREDVRYDY